jgi:hypothetical protein
MKRIRFSLRLLIVLVSAIALFLGYSQWRRREILKLCDQLKQERYSFTVPDDWRDRWLWQRKPTVAKVQYVPDYDQEVLIRVRRVNGQDVISAEVKPQEIERLKKLGVVEVE